MLPLFLGSRLTPHLCLGQPLTLHQAEAFSSEVPVLLELRTLQGYLLLGQEQEPLLPLLRAPQSHPKLEPLEEDSTSHNPLLSILGRQNLSAPLQWDNKQSPDAKSRPQCAAESSPVD